MPKKATGPMTAARTEFEKKTERRKANEMEPAQKMRRDQMRSDEMRSDEIRSDEIR